MAQNFLWLDYSESDKPPPPPHASDEHAIQAHSYHAVDVVHLTYIGRFPCTMHSYTHTHIMLVHVQCRASHTPIMQCGVAHDDKEEDCNGHF